MVGALAAPLRALAPVLDDVDAFMRRTSQERRSSWRMSAGVRPMLQLGRPGHETDHVRTEGPRRFAPASDADAYRVLCKPTLLGNHDLIRL